MANSLIPGTGAPTALEGKRERLVRSARQSFHEHGVETTTLSDIAAAADVPLGNVYYYFKTKDALVAAVIETYGHTYELMSAWLEQQPTPQARLKALIQAWVSNREQLAAHGCPVGSLSSELDKRTDDLRTQAAAVLAQLVGWAQRQFESMGRSDARELAVALVAAYEGVALLANTLGDPGLVSAEGRRLQRWIDDLAQGGCDPGTG
jgi:TetR/AcrR family transcriptional regulator, transcriptional repressor for nem operon